MKFFNYCFYRISSAYKFLDNTGYYISGNVIVSACQSFNTIALFLVLFSLIDIKLTQTAIILIGVFFVIINLFLYDKKKYNKLSEQWKDEKHKTLKGWLVFAYVVASLVLFFASLYI